MRNKGFTLVELLAVIVILAIILAIAIPGISNVVSSSTKASVESDAKMVLKAIEYKMMDDETFDPTSVNETNVNTLLNISNDNYQSLTVKKMNDKLYVTIVGKNKWNNFTVSGTQISTKVLDTTPNFVRGANAPKLAEGMKPIIWNEDSKLWEEVTEDDPNWYNYDTTNKRWANARTNDCGTPGDIETCSMWVWIPRYVYRISNGWHTSTAGTIDIQFTKGIDDNWNKAVIGTIDVREGAVASDATTNGNKYTNHPAFTFGDTELTGIWVAKFEATAVEGVVNGYLADYSCPLEGDNVTSKTVKVIPNAQSWRCISIGNMFTVSRNMETNDVYGWGTSGKNIDTHMMKNEEWGAIAYLSKSVYGINDEIWINPADDYTTGCAGASASTIITTSCLYSYDKLDGPKASTTGNIYGVYDMAGGAWEHVSAYIDNGAIALTTNGLSIINADRKYKTIYSVGTPDNRTANYQLVSKHKGDAMYETSIDDNRSSWYADFSSAPNKEVPWFGRSGAFRHTSSAGAFAFSYCDAIPYSNDGFRPTLLVDEGL